jgi:hypothetical protein
LSETKHCVGVWQLTTRDQKIHLIMVQQVFFGLPRRSAADLDHRCAVQRWSKFPAAAKRPTLAKPLETLNSASSAELSLFNGLAVGYLRAAPNSLLGAGGRKRFGSSV